MVWSVVRSRKVRTAILVAVRVEAEVCQLPPSRQCLTGGSGFERGLAGWMEAWNEGVGVRGVAWAWADRADTT